jgi:hypothetical protein
MKIFTTKKIPNGERKVREKPNMLKPRNDSSDKENSPTSIVSMKMLSSQRAGMTMMI